MAALGLIDYALWDFADFGLQLYKCTDDSVLQMRAYAISLVDKLGILLLANYVVAVFLFVKWVITSKRKQRQV